MARKVSYLSYNMTTADANNQRMAWCLSAASGTSSAMWKQSR